MQMVLLMQKVMELEINLNNPKKMQADGRDSMLLSLNIERQVEKVEQKRNASFSMANPSTMYLISLTRTRGKHKPPKKSLSDP